MQVGDIRLSRCSACSRIQKERPEDRYKIWKIMALQNMPRHEDAQTLLEEIARQVQPIIIKHKWTIRLLSEHWSDESSCLLGMNRLGVNVMILRLRRADNKHTFIPIHDIIDTLFHELCHNDHGSQHLHFKSLLNDLRMEYDDHVSRRGGLIATSMVSDARGRRPEDMTRQPPPPSTKDCCSACGRIQKEDRYKVREIKALCNMPRHEDAQKLLEEIAKQVKPIMNKHKWRVHVLSEFWPENAYLLGVNCERGVNVMLRLRRTDKEDEFLPIHNILDTMLHELCHNVYAAHNLDFQNLWNDLRMEYDDLVSQKRLTASSKVSNFEGRRLEDMTRQRPPSTKACDLQEKRLARQHPRLPCRPTLFKFHTPLLFHILPWVTFTS